MEFVNDYCSKFGAVAVFMLEKSVGCPVYNVIFYPDLLCEDFLGVDIFGYFVDNNNMMAF